MKKLFLSLIILTGASQLKAQQLDVKPSDPLLFKSPKDLNLQQFKLGDSTLFKNFSTPPTMQQLAALPQINSNELFNGNMSVTKITSSIDHMPIAKVSGNIDHMPIAKVNGNIDHMPVAKIGGDMDKMSGETIIVPKPVNP
jgi:hypothetical protein